MKRVLMITSVILFCVVLTSCSRTIQTESLNSPQNQGGLLKALKSAAVKLNLPPSSRISTAYVLREAERFSTQSAMTPIGKFLNVKLGSYYPFKSDELSEHQKNMVDTFIKNTVLADPSFSLKGEGGAPHLLIIAYMRSYTVKKELYFDIFDFSSGDLVSRAQYEMSDLTYQFEQKM